VTTNDWRPGESLTAAEQEMCRGSEIGGIVAGVPGPYNLAAMQAWGPDRTIRASVLRNLLLADEWLVHENGVRLRGMMISGHLDLSNASLRCSLQLDACYVPEPVSLSGATVSLFVMKECHVAGLMGDLLVASKFVDLGGTTFTGPVRLMLADIRGGLSCRGCHLSGPDKDGVVLFAERIKVGADVFLDKWPGQRRFVAEGALRMSGATIAGNLSCVGARLAAAGKDGTSLMAQYIRVGGSAAFTSHQGEIGFSAQGTVNLVFADIAGAVDCSGATLSGGQDALRAAGMRVGSGVLLGSGFTASGAIELRGADISANLAFRDGAQLNGVNAEGSALHAPSIRVGGYLQFYQGFNADGAVCLVDADIARDVEFLGAKLDGPNAAGNSIAASGIEVGGAMVFGDGLTTAGAIDLRGADISDNLVFRGETLLGGANMDGNSLHADGMTVGGNVLVRDRFAAIGAIYLVDATVAGNLECRGVQLHGINKKGNTLHAERLKVGSQLYLDQGFAADGTIYLLGADIKGNLECRGGRFRGQNNGRAINAERMTVGGDVYLDTIGQSRFTAEGTVYLLKANIGGVLSCSGAHLRSLTSAGDALFAERTNIGGDVRLNKGLTASGNIQLKAATIGGSLEIEPYCLELDKRRFALDATDMRVSGRLRWAPERPIQGRVSLEGATAGQLEDSWTGTGPGRERRENGYWPTGGRLRLDGFTYGGFAGESQPDVRQRLQWLRSQYKPKLPDTWEDERAYASTANLRERGYTAQPYKQLGRTYQEVGKDTEARTVAIAQRRDRLKYGHLTWFRKIFDRLLNLFIGYGYQTWKVGLALLVLFAGVFIFMLLAKSHNAFEPAQNATLLHPAPAADTCGNNYPCFDPFGYTIDTVVPLIDVHQTDFWAPNASNTWGAACIVVTYGGTAFGWLFATFAVAGATGIVRKIDPS